MSDHKRLEDPTNRIVSVFDDLSHADAARQELLEHGITDDQIRVMRGEEAAAKVDTSAKWFADTDVEIEKYQRELSAGKTVVSVPLQDSADRDTLHAILKRHGARLTTHFGEWVTEMMQ
jgi:hypothetical protein